MKVFNDAVHGYIEMDDTSVSIIDTPQFQRLRDLKQLGCLYMIFPGASHNRFEHSLGVGHLAASMVSSFQQKQPELEIDNHDVKMLRIAGLIHDLGHGPFSHVFENEFMPRVSSSFCHEEFGTRIFDYLIDDNAIDGLESHDISFIKSIVLGAKSKNNSGILSNEKQFLYEIVANGKNGVDVDKFDYLARDTLNLFGKGGGYDSSRLMAFNRVINNEVCYHSSVTFDIYNVFSQRYQLHKTIYTHRKAKAIEYMICDAMVLADKPLGISASTHRPSDFLYMNDTIVSRIESSTDSSLLNAQEIIKRIRTRKLYAFVDEYLVPASLVDKIPKITPVDVSTSSSSSYNISHEDIIVHDGKLNYNLKDRNPVDFVSFYTTKNPTVSFHTSKTDVSLLFPEKFEERIIRVYSRSGNEKTQEAILKAFRTFLGKFSSNLPPPSPATKVNTSTSMSSSSSNTASRQLFKRQKI